MTPFITIASVPAMVVFAAVIFGVVVIFGWLGMFIKCFHKVKQGTALIKNGLGGHQVSFTGMFVVPVIHDYEIMDITARQIDVTFEGQECATFKGGEKADLRVSVWVMPIHTAASILKVAQEVGVDKVNDAQLLAALFRPKFEGTLERVCRGMELDEVLESQDVLRAAMIKEISGNLFGFDIYEVVVQKVNPLVAVGA
ncbi:MAG: SPFH domain-containing protein [Planctomycetes bacterium]|nr:SPFH domain-containing protein [Planctomycetota bacterium]